MSRASFFETHLGSSLQDFVSMPRDKAAAALRSRLPDLLWFLRRGALPGQAHEPHRTVHLAASLETALTSALAPTGVELQSLRDRIVTDAFLRSEFDRDQNVYMGSFFTRVLTRAVPDVVFQPRTHQEVEAVLGWARRQHVGIATRGAGTTAMGGSVPNDGGLLLDLSRFDHIQVDRADGVAVVGAGARFKQIHATLAAQGLALPSYPSNLGGTLAGWFSAGGLGLNSFHHGPVQSQVRALSMVLPRGEHVRFHDDGRLDVLAPGSKRLAREEGERWLVEHGYPVLALGDLAQTEGQLGVLLTLSVRVQPLPSMTPFYFEFDAERAALEFVDWVVGSATGPERAPANLKYLSAAHVAGVRRLRRRQDGTAARPAVYVDFESESAARAFEAALARRHPAAGQRQDLEARQWHADRFRPQQTKRLGPGYLAAEILLPRAEVARYLEGAGALAKRAGIHLETEVYFFGDGRALALPGFLTRGPRSGFVWQLAFVATLLDLALARHAGAPYVLGRWQSPYFGRKVARDRGRMLRAAKRRADPKRRLNPGVFFAPALRSPLAQIAFRATFPAAVRMLRGFYGSWLTAPFLRAWARAGAHPGDPLPSWRQADGAAAARDRDAVLVAAELDRLSSRDLAHAARGCVNCGECNSVCPVFHDSKIRLPQMLTHIGERLGAGDRFAGTEQLLLDLCMRCGNCQEVCQADIPHLPLYAALDPHAGTATDERRERHQAILAHLRHSERYMREFLAVRPGGYLQRTPASLPGEVRYILLRSENDAGPVDTCIHCGACVSVCPTQANLEFQESGDLRRITTDLNRCIGCGTCVEVCPANHQSDGRTLRVMEAPTREFFEVFAGFESGTEENGK